MQGDRLRCAEEWWVDVLPNMSNTPINYVEIGVFCGHNFCSVANTFARHPESKLYAIDPWANYEAYNETYTQDENYKAFCHNIEYNNIQNKVIECRGFSENIMPTFPDEFFDIIYIDGSHLYEYVVKDCENALKKIKKNGYIIVDDTSHPPVINGCDHVFENSENKIRMIKNKVDQRYYQKYE